MVQLNSTYKYIKTHLFLSLHLFLELNLFLECKDVGKINYNWPIIFHPIGYKHIQMPVSKHVSVVCLT